MDRDNVIFKVLRTLLSTNDYYFRRSTVNQKLDQCIKNIYFISPTVVDRQTLPARACSHSTLNMNTCPFLEGRGVGGTMASGLVPSTAE